MRSAWLGPLIVIALAGCGGGATDADAGSDAGPPPPFVEASWRVRCDVMGGCTGYPDRTLMGFHDDGEHEVTCRVWDVAAGRRVDLQAADGSVRFALQIQATFAGAGGIPVDTEQCAVAAVEVPSEIWGGACTGDVPTETAPCQLSNVIVAPDGEDRARVRGTVRCMGMQRAFVASPQRRELTAPGDGAAAASTAMMFDFRGCAVTTE